MELTDEITTIDQLRAVIAPPNEIVTAKEVDALDDHCRDFIGRSPFVLIASADGEGSIDVSPKGDPPGFVRVLDDRTLAVPERPGNHRADTFENVLRHPYAGLIFLVPGTRNTLRVRGRARIVADPDLRESLAVDGKVPALVLVVEVRTAYFHCAKCILRSGLWSEPGRASGRRADATLLAETMVRHGELAMTVDQMQHIIDDDEVERLY